MLKSQITEKKWIVLYAEDMVIIFPDSDCKPHGKKISKFKYDIQFISCGCNPDVKWEHNIPLVTHNSFDGREWTELRNMNIING